MRNRLILLVCIMSIMACSTDQRQHQVKIADVHDISGFIGDRIDLNREVYLKDFPIDKYVDFIVNRGHTD